MGKRLDNESAKHKKSHTVNVLTSKSWFDLAPHYGVDLFLLPASYVHPPFRKTLADWEALARKRLGPERLSTTNKGFSTRRRVSSIVNRWNAVSTIRRLGDALSLCI